MPEAVPASEPAALAPADVALVAALKAGEPAAFEQLVRQHGPRMLAVARQILAPVMIEGAILGIVGLGMAILALLLPRRQTGTYLPY